VSITRRSALRDVAAAVARALDAAGISAVLTGGACATIYSSGRYQSRDLDFVIRSGGSRGSLDTAMASIGFRRDRDRYVHRQTPFFVEFPRGPLAIGNDIAVNPVDLKLGRGHVLALSPTDACRDRLAAFYHWSDRQSLDVAVEIASANKVSMRTIARWSRTEDAIEKFEEFRRELGRRTARQPANKLRGVAKNIEQIERGFGESKTVRGVRIVRRPAGAPV